MFNKIKLKIFISLMESLFFNDNNKEDQYVRIGNYKIHIYNLGSKKFINIRFRGNGNENQNN